MIFGNIQNLEEYPFLEEQIKECFAYAREHELVSLSLIHISEPTRH